jgi:hypothetical protein
MPQSDASNVPSRHPRATSRRDLLRLDFRRDPEQLSEAIQGLLDRSDLSSEERVQVLGGALVLEALRPYWGDGRTPADAHALLRRDDPELADAIESIAPMLLGRAQAQEDAQAALDAVNALLGQG